LRPQQPAAGLPSTGSRPGTARRSHEAACRRASSVPATGARLARSTTVMSIRRCARQQHVVAAGAIVTSAASAVQHREQRGAAGQAAQLK
jgi:hypothetical protein